MHIEFAAHVDHDISHSSSTAQIGLGIALALTAVGTCLSGVGTLACVGAIGLRMGVGLDVGGIVDNFLPSGVAGKITAGLDTVLLGPGIKAAARAHESTTVDCHASHVSQGSDIVVLGKELSPMSRRQDKTRCDGVICDGLRTVFVGGQPSETGKQTEAPNAIVWWMGLGAGIASLGNPLSKGDLAGAAWSAGGTALDAAGQGELGAAARLAGGSARYPSGGSLWDKADWAFGMKKTGGTGLDAANGLVGH